MVVLHQIKSFIRKLDYYDECITNAFLKFVRQRRNIDDLKNCQVVETGIRFDLKSWNIIQNIANLGIWFLYSFDIDIEYNLRLNFSLPVCINKIVFLLFTNS